METLKLCSTGPHVELLQNILMRLNLYRGPINGDFGANTLNSVKQFQLKFKLIRDGIVGIQTWDALFPYINGSTIYSVKKGDSLSKISKKYNSNVNRILSANPNIDINNLAPDQKIIVPFGNIIPTNISYSSNILNLNIAALKRIYPFLAVSSMGNSTLGKQLTYIKLGTGNKEVFYSASIHANEWITCPILMKFLEDFCFAYVNNTNIFGYSAREILKDTTIYIAPMCNPDGVDLVTGQISPDTPIYNYAKSISDNYPNIPFPSGWKANMQGIDLNLQFPAEWENAREIKYAKGFNVPAPRDFVGPSPLVAPESRAIYDFTSLHNFRLILTYHTQGKEIYWQFLDYGTSEAESVGKELARVSSYELAEVPYTSSFAGYKDWFMQEYRKPGYTIEAGFGESPLPISQFNQIYKNNLGILVLGAIL